MATQGRTRLTNRRTYFVQRGPRSDRLSHAEEMLLTYGPAPEWRDAFESIEAARAVWARYRERLMSRKAPGRRPWGWYEFEAPPELPYRYDTERSALFAAGLLTDSERKELVAYWREQFTRTREPGFTVVRGQNNVLHGPEAVAFHLAFVDVPPRLIAEWEAEDRA